MRFTEEELRDFLFQHANLWRDEEFDAEVRDYPEEVAYARGAHEAYDFVLRFMDEYKLEEVAS